MSPRPRDLKLMSEAVNIFVLKFLVLNLSISELSNQITMPAVLNKQRPQEGGLYNQSQRSRQHHHRVARYQRFFSNNLHSIILPRSYWYSCNSQEIARVLSERGKRKEETKNCTNHRGPYL